MSVRLRQALSLAGPLVRNVPWVPVAAAVVVSALALLPAVADASTPASQVWGLRIAAVVLGAAASFALVEPMALLSVTPTPRWLRQWLRVTIALVPVAAVWGCLWAIAASSAAPARLPLSDLVGEAAVCALAGVVGAAVAARRGHSMTTAVAGPAAQGGLMVATLFLPTSHSAWPLPGAPQWERAHDWWWVAFLILVAVLVAANGEVWPRRWGRSAADGSGRSVAGGSVTGGSVAGTSVVDRTVADGSVAGGSVVDESIAGGSVADGSVAGR